MLGKIDHIGIAVRSLTEAIPFYRDVLSMDFMGVEEVPDFKVRVAMLRVGETKIELLEPTCAESFLAGFLETSEEGIHHIAYEVEDVESAIGKLEGAGVRMLDRKPRPGAHGTKVAFIHPESSRGVLTELCQPEV